MSLYNAAASRAKLDTWSRLALKDNCSLAIGSLALHHDGCHLLPGQLVVLSEPVGVVRQSGR